MMVHWLTTLPLCALIAAAGARSTAAQAGPPCGPDLPIQCTPGKDAALLLGFAGAGALAVYLAYRMDHPRAELTIAGCTTRGDGGMTLMEQGTQTPYLLTPVRKTLKAGEHLVLKGKKSQDREGRNIFRVRKIVEDDGPCGLPATAPNEQGGLE